MGIGMGCQCEMGRMDETEHEDDNWSADGDEDDNGVETAKEIAIAIGMGVD